MKSGVRPRERVELEGVQSLEDVELIALLLGTGHQGKEVESLAQEVLGLAQGCLSTLAAWPVEGLRLVPGIGQAKAMTLAAAMELGRRRHHRSSLQRELVRSSKDIYVRFASRLRDLQHEEFWILLMRRSNTVLAELCISRGGLSGTVVDPKLVFGRALAMRASAMVLVHNHPSGNAKPSQADRDLTHRLWKAGKNLDLPVLDHIVVAGDTYVSFADEGWLS